MVLIGIGLVYWGAIYILVRRRERDNCVKRGIVFSGLGGGGRSERPDGGILSKRLWRGLFEIELEVVELELVPKMISGAGGPGKDKTTNDERDAGDDAGVGIPGGGLVVAIGSVDGVEDEDACGGGKHAIGQNGVAEIKMAPADGTDLLIMKAEAVYKNGVMFHLCDGAIEPLSVDGFHIQYIAFGIGMDERASFLQYEQIGLRLCEEGNKANK